MRVVLVNYGHPGDAGDFDALVAGVRTLDGWARALVRAGATVTVVQGFRHTATHQHGGVTWRLVAGPFTPYLWPWRVPRALHRQVIDARPEVVHLNSLLYALQARDLRRRLPRDVALVLQHHGERPRGSRLGRAVQRRLLGAADGFLFNGEATAEPWRTAGLLGGRPLVAIAEGSSELVPSARDDARRASGLAGEPLVLWLANLDANKDPLTVLDGLEPFLARRPKARFVMAYRHGQLEPEVKRRIDASAVLQRATTLLGRVPYPRLGTVVSSADLFVQGSHREGSGYALIDALACGVVPVVSDIPSFRFLTGEGAVGALWPPGDAGALETALEQIMRLPLPPQRRSARDHFVAGLAYDALARQALDVYRRLRAGRGRG